MKLLSKSAVNNEVANQKKSQIDEGLFIAKKIDSLRQTLTGLEKQHRDFINGMQSELNIQIQPLIDKIANLKLEIEDLENKRRKLLAPLTKEWEEVLLKRKQIEAKELEFSQKEIIFGKDREVLDARLKKEKENIFKINTVKNQISKSFDKQKENEEKSENLLKEAEKTKQESLLETEDRNKTLLSREAMIAVRERENQMVEENNKREKQFINEEKIRLADMRRTLERAILRTKKNG